MSKKKILVIIPDRFVKASGGMGENSAPVFESLSKYFDFYVAGFPLAGEKVPDYIKEYREVSGSFSEVKLGTLMTIASQINYFSVAASFPKPDVIYAYDWSIYLSAVKTAEFFKVPLITRMSLSAIELGQINYTYGLDLTNPVSKALHNSLCEMEVRGLQKADRIVQISNGYAKRWEGITNFKEKTRIVPNGINLKKWEKKFDEPYPLPGHAKYKVIYIGRLVAIKGVLELCKAEIPKEIDLIFIGSKDFSDPECMKVINDKMRSNNNVHYIGPLYGDNKIRALQGADAVIIPSLHEPFGTVGLEGLASRSIVLSSRIDGLGDYLNDNNSIFCGTKNKIIEQALKQFIAMSEEEKAQKIENGIKICNEYNLESTVNKLKSVFDELI